MTLFIASHTDDEICFAGFAQKQPSGYIALSNCDSPTLHKECLSSVAKMKMEEFEIKSFPVRKFRLHRQKIADFFHQTNERYTTIVTHDVNDIHPDHRVVAEESIRIFKTQNVLTYIAPWNGDESPNYFVELTEDELKLKIKVMQCYKSQSYRKYMTPDFIRAQARYNGMRCGKLYAEGFKVVRLVQ